MVKLMFMVLSLLGASAWAGDWSSTSEQGPSQRGIYWRQTGCDTLTNNTDNLPAGYTVTPKIDSNHDLMFCGNMYLDSVDRMEQLEQIAALVKGCWDIQVDRAHKVVTIKMDKNVLVIPRTEEGRTYNVCGVNGFKTADAVHYLTLDR